MTRLRRVTGLILILTLILLAGTKRQVAEVGAAQEALQPTLQSGLLFGIARVGTPSVSNLYQIDSSTGVATLIGPVGFNGISGMDFNPMTGELYAIGRRLTESTEVLITINPMTGAGTEIGPLGRDAFVLDISFRNSDAILFGVTDDSSLIRIDTSTGAQIIVARPCRVLDGNGIAFSPNDTLYHADNRELSIYNQSTCRTTIINRLRFPSGLGSNPRVAAMDFQPGTFMLYGTIITGQGFTGGGPAYLATIDTITGGVTIIGATVSRMDALAWAPAAAPVFDICLQDETQGNTLQINLSTGAYQFANCNGSTSGGVGILARRGCLVTLEVGGPDRRIVARIDTCSRIGTAYVQILPTGRNFSIIDRNIDNNTCLCPHS